MEKAIICPKCKIIIKPTEENSTLYAKCGNCGYKKEFTDWVPHACGKCGYDKAVIVYYASTRGDEETTTLYRCIRCGATSREGWMSNV